MEAAKLPTPLPSLDDANGGRRLPLGSLLVREGLLTREQLEQALAEKERTGHRIGEIVVERGWAQPQDVARALAEQHGLEFVDLAQAKLEPAAANLLPEKFARRYDALPVRFLDEASCSSLSPTRRTSSRRTISASRSASTSASPVAPAPDLHSTIGRVYRTQVDVGVIEEEPDEDETAVDDIREGAATSAPAIKLVNSLIARAIDEGASDLHFEPQPKQLVVRARIDGVMRRLTTISKSMQPAITSRLKIMGELDIAERRAPQDGRVSIRVGGQPMDLRIAVLPTTHGEQIVLRIMNRAGVRLGLPQLGMSPDAEESFSRAIRQPYGAVIACGPTGSGKTTTLYAALDMLNDEDRVLTTIEDPVEYQTPGINQIEVNPKSGLTFSRGLRTMLRSDPDVLLVGEIRDEETARIAIQAAMTGHLVLTTLHAHNAASAIARLKDMGVDAGLLASSVNCIVAQRLARRLCSDCRRAYAADADERAELGVGSDELKVYRGEGCLRCGNTGYRGRVALYEVMPIEGRLTRMFDQPTEEIYAAAVKQGMTTLREDGVRLCLAGITSLDEVRRVTGDRPL